MENNLDKLIGQKFGRLTITKAYIKEGGRRIVCDCDCECGNKLIAYPFSYLANGNTKSCGCLRKSKELNPKMGHPTRNRIGERFDKCVIIAENMETGVATAKCDCGNIFEIPSFRRKMYRLRKNAMCPKCKEKLKEEKEKNKKYGDLKPGDKFGYFTVIKRVENNKSGLPQYECKCQCGTKKVVEGRYLVNGQIKSCGCIKKQNFQSIKTLNGLTGTPEGNVLYSIWKYYIKKYNKNNTKTKFFPEWANKKNGFIDFYNWATLKKEPFDSQTRKHIARFDEDKDFTPENCYFSRIRG